MDAPGHSLIQLYVPAPPSPSAHRMVHGWHGGTRLKASAHLHWSPDNVMSDASQANFGNPSGTWSDLRKDKGLPPNNSKSATNATNELNDARNKSTVNCRNSWKQHPPSTWQHVMSFNRRTRKFTTWRMI